MPGLPGHSRSVILDSADSSKIEEAIKGLWRDTAAVDGAARTVAEETEPMVQVAPLLRACVLNLVCVVDNARELEDTLKTVGEISESYPVRSIILVCDDSMPSEATASEVGSPCTQASSEHPHASCETIVVRAGIDAFEGLHQTASALFVEDLRRYLWWEPLSRLKGKLYQRLITSVDRIILDSRRSKEEPDAFDAVIAAVEDPHSPPVSDLNWGRITPWREITAQLFDSPRLTPALNGIVRLDITYANQPEGELYGSALFYAAWIASVLQWEVLGTDDEDKDGQPETDETEVLCRRPDRRLVKVRLFNVPRPGSEGRLVQVRIVSNRPSAAEFIIGRSDDMMTASIIARVGGTETISSCVSLEPQPHHKLIVNELNFAGRDHLYEHALPLAAQLLKALTT